jgi:hypothetical protein
VSTPKLDGSEREEAHALIFDSTAKHGGIRTRLRGTTVAGGVRRGVAALAAAGTPRARGGPRCRRCGRAGRRAGSSGAAHGVTTPPGRIGRPHRDPPLPGRGSEGAARRAAPPRRRDTMAHHGVRRRPLPRRATGDRSCTGPLLDDQVRVAQVRGEAERTAAVQNRDRRRRHPLHPRALPARRGAAADHDARLARLHRRAARDGRAAHRPHHARRPRPGRVRPRAAVDSRLRLLEPADRARLGDEPHRTRLGGAHAAPRLHPLRPPGRRRRRGHHRQPGPPGAGGGCSAST